MVHTPGEETVDEHPGYNGTACMVDITLVPPRQSLRDITTTRELAALMGVSYSREFAYILYRFPPTGRYRSFNIAKKSGGDRQINAPIRLLKKLQRRLVPLLAEIYDAPPCVRGFQGGQSILTNASDHVGQRYVLNLDLNDFFPSIHFKRVSGILQTRRYSLSRDVAVAIAQIACHGGQLPIGAPTSGILANMVCGPLDSSLLRLAKAHKLRYTRYADDITFSTSNSRHLNEATGIHVGDRFVIRGTEELSDSFHALFTQNGFSLNPNKAVLMSRRVRQSVTGLTVNRKTNVSKEFYRNLKSSINAIENYGYEAAQSVYIDRFRKPNESLQLRENLLGRLAFLGHVLNYSERYNKLARRTARLFEERSIPRPRDDREKAIYVLTNEQDLMMGTAFHTGGGKFLTAAHIFADRPGVLRCELACPPHYPEQITAVVSHIDRERDIALVRATGTFDLSRHSIPTDGKSVRIGDDVFACGFPQYEDGNSISTISTRITAERYISGNQRLEVDRPLSHGSSGGPVFSRDGFLVGQINTGPRIGEDYSPMSYTITPFRPHADLVATWLAA